MRNAKTILVRGANWLGDALMTLPALNALAGNFPGNTLHVLTLPGLGAVYEKQPGVRAILPYERQGRHQGLRGRLRLASELRREAFDLALLFPNSFDSALLPFLSGIPYRLGYSRDGRGVLLTHPVRPTAAYSLGHKVFYFLHILEKAGLEAPFSLPRVYPGQEGQRQADSLMGPPHPHEFVLAIAPGAAFGNAKRWPPEQFARAAALILEQRPGRVIFLGTEGDAEAARKSGEFLLRLRPDIVSRNLAGRTSVAGVNALLQRASLLLTNDSGMMHLAGAVGTPLAATFGPTDPLLYAPLERGVAVHASCACAPCSHRECPQDEQICFTGVTPEKMALAALKALEPGPSRQRNCSPAVFLYCDDSLLELPEGPASPEKMRIRPCSARSLALLSGAGFKIVLVAALPDIPQDSSSHAHQKDFCQALVKMLDTQGVGFDALYACQYHADGQMEDLGQKNTCPVSAEHFFAQVGEALSIDLGHSFWVGEKRRDIQAATAVNGCGILIATRKGIREAANRMAPAGPRLMAPNLLRAVEWILCGTRKSTEQG